MEFIAYRVFSAELKRIEQLSLITPFAFGATRAALVQSVRDKKLDLDQEIMIDGEAGERLPVKQFLHRLDSQAPRYQRELLFTRLISALEVYLIDLIREMATSVPNVFESDDHLDVSRRELFSFQNMRELLMYVVNKDCRALSSGGFNEITKYYKNKLGIDYRPLTPGINVLQEYHDRRHLLVHKLGQTDEAYRHKYSSDAKKISIDSAYLRGAIANTRAFSTELNNLIMQKMLGVPPKSTDAYRGICILFYQDELPEFLKPDSSFRHGGIEIALSTIMLRHELNKNRVTMAFEGERAPIESFAQTLASAHRNGIVRIDYVNPKNLFPRDVQIY